MEHCVCLQEPEGMIPIPWNGGGGDQGLVLTCHPFS